MSVEISRISRIVSVNIQQEGKKIKNHGLDLALKRDQGFLRVVCNHIILPDCQAPHPMKFYTSQHSMRLTLQLTLHFKVQEEHSSVWKVVCRVASKDFGKWFLFKDLTLHIHVSIGPRHNPQLVFLSKIKKSQNHKGKCCMGKNFLLKL